MNAWIRRSVMSLAVLFVGAGPGLAQQAEDDGTLSLRSDQGFEAYYPELDSYYFDLSQARNWADAVEGSGGSVTIEAEVHARQSGEPGSALRHFISIDNERYLLGSEQSYSIFVEPHYGTGFLTGAWTEVEEWVPYREEMGGPLHWAWTPALDGYWEDATVQQTEMLRQWVETGERSTFTGEKRNVAHTDEFVTGDTRWATGTRPLNWRWAGPPPASEYLRSYASGPWSDPEPESFWEDESYSRTRPWIHEYWRYEISDRGDTRNGHVARLNDAEVLGFRGLRPLNWRDYPRRLWVGIFPFGEPTWSGPDPDRIVTYATVQRIQPQVQRWENWRVNDRALYLSDFFFLGFWDEEAAPATQVVGGRRVPSAMNLSGFGGLDFSITPAGTAAGGIRIGPAAMSFAGIARISLPGGVAISPAPGGAVVTGYPAVASVPTSTTVRLGTLGSVTADIAGNITVVAGSGVPGLTGSVLELNAGGGGRLVLPSGGGVAVSASGRLRMILPPGTDPVLVKAVDLAGAILQPDSGVVISVRDLLGGIVPLPSSGLLGDLDVGITSTGVFSIGLKIDDRTTFWFDVNTPEAPQLAVDLNRNGAVTFASEDLTTAALPYRFWVNDDIDREHLSDDNAIQDDIGPDEAILRRWDRDWNDARIVSERDLEDVARLIVRVPGAVDRFRRGELYLGLKWVDVAGYPSVRIYPQLDRAGGTGYLTDPVAGQAQTSAFAVQSARYGLVEAGAESSPAGTLVKPGETFILPPSLWSELSPDNRMRPLLFESCSPGKGRLVPVLLSGRVDGWSELSETSGVWLEFKRIGDFYEHWSVGNRNGGVPDAVAGRIASESGSGIFKYQPNDPEEMKYLLFVHGWNMEKWEKERFAETAYKRLWWQGYKGRFGLFSWPTTYGFSIWDIATDGDNYNEGELAAWNSASRLRSVLQALAAAHRGDLYLYAHSMGNVVVSEALRLQRDGMGGPLARVYVASQAAIPAHVFDGTLSEAPGSATALQWHWKGRDWGPNTANVYRDWVAPISRGSWSSPATVGRVVNFYNENDYALSAGVWQLNQALKPGGAFQFGPSSQYGFSGPISGTGTTGFFAYPAGDQEVRFLNLGTRTLLRDRYEIMSFAAESRVKALGSIAGTVGVLRSVSLRALWPFDEQNHESHPWHSAQFRMTNQTQHPYWKMLLGSDGMNL